MNFFKNLWDNMTPFNVLSKVGMGMIVIGGMGFQFFGLPLSYFLYLFTAGLASTGIAYKYFSPKNPVVVGMNPKAINVPEIQIGAIDDPQAHISSLQNAECLQKSIQLTSQLKQFKNNANFLGLIKKSLNESINEDNIKDIAGGLNFEDLPQNHPYRLATHTIFRQNQPQDEGAHQPLRRRNIN